MKETPNALALTPLLLFLALFFGVGIYHTLQGTELGFYELRAPVAMLPAVALAAWIAARRGIQPGETLLRGMGESNIMLMCLIFLLAGAFATVSKTIGAVDAVVALGLSYLPPTLLVPGLFVVSAFISLAIGTSVGTILAVVPIAVGIAHASGMHLPLVVGAVIGGAMFGDNLSVISDTTIAATRTQGTRMGDKFRENFKIALPAALLTVVLLFFSGQGNEPIAPLPETRPVLILPYLLVLALALLGVDVLLMLAIGIVAALAFGLGFVPDYTLEGASNDVWNGFESMAEIVFLSMLVGGLGALMKAAGGLAWLSQSITKLARGHRGVRSGELSIAALAAGTDVFTANNTVAILISGSVARDIAQQHGVSPRRAASVLDIFACVMQGVIPWGAQILLAASLAALSPLQLVGKIWYCWLLALMALGFILWPHKRILSAAVEQPQAS